ncbi:hypothetical protein [Algibacter mikhailovii]|uniref:Tetratricopeptide repeat protein n=1 Tax=Algibacter mikhailovii TaxID=425498 RepID=A0A918VBA0_9FLAO|nr:hypothetical protein [Algibacter mikhailovii]GGZ85742.1 hypothetical protein GCM10007028_25010 [Algibacter mikhailovii]
MKTRITTFLIAFLFILTASAKNILVNKSDGTSENIAYNHKTLLNKGLQNDKGSIISFQEISAISTSDFDAYDEILRKTQRRATHVKVEFTGDMNKYAARLEKLKRNRDGADVTRGVGGIMSIIGVLSGDRELTAAGIAVNGAGYIARNINDDRTADTQTAMLNELDNRTKKIENQPESEEDQLRKNYGDENVDGLKELMSHNYEKATAYANVGELSKDANHRLSAMWLKALIAADQNLEVETNKAYSKIVTFDPEIKNIQEAEKETTNLLAELEALRN